MTPTPNDTKKKQFLTALSLTALFAIGAALLWFLFHLSDHLKASTLAWIEVCGIAVGIVAWVLTVIFIIVAVLSLLDWMRATTHNPRKARRGSGHSGRHAHI